MLWRRCYRLGQRRHGYEQGRRRQTKTLILGNYPEVMGTVPASLQLRRPLQEAFRAWTRVWYRLRPGQFAAAVNGVERLQFRFPWRRPKSEGGHGASRDVESRAEGRFHCLDLSGDSAGNGDPQLLLLRQRLLHGMG